MDVPARRSLRALAAAALLLAAGCAPAIGSAVGDAQLAMRVQTALLNDPEIGTLPIEVRASGGVVTLRGRIRSEADRERAVRLARGVDGVRDVTADLTIADVPPDEVQRPRLAPPRAQPDRVSRLVALGAAVTHTRPQAEGLRDALSVGPILRLRQRPGWAPAIGFSWTDLEIDAGPEGDRGLADLRLRPVMVGLAYGAQVGQATLSASVVGGWSFNQVRVHHTETGPLRAIAVDNGPAWRPGASVWYDVTSRVGVQVFVGGLFASPRVTFASDDELRTMRMRTNAAIFSVGLAWWLF